MENKLSNQRSGLKADLFDIFMGLFCFGAVFLCIYIIQRGVHFYGIGFAAVYTVFFAVGTAYIKKKQKKADLGTIFTGAACLLTAVGIALHEGASSMYAIPMLLILSVCYCTELSGVGRYSSSSYLYIIELFRITFFEPMGNLFLPYVSAVRRIKSEKMGFKLVGVILGALLALPVFALSFALLQSGDAVFESLTYKITQAIDDFLYGAFDFDEVVYIAACALVITPFIYSTMFGFKYRTALSKEKKLNYLAEKSEVVSPNIMGGFLGSVALLYLAYLVSQTAYLFSAFGSKVYDAANITLAQYARRGFFEMSTVAVINLCLIAAGVIFCKRKDGKIVPAIKGISIFICAFTMVLTVTAMSKMGLYIAQYGLTHKRLLVFLIDIVLFVCFGCMIAKFLCSKMPYMRIIITVGCVLAVGTALVNSDYIIGTANVKLFLSGYHEEIDLDEIYNLDECTAMKCFDELLKKGEDPDFSKETVKMYMSRIYDNNKDYHDIYNFDRLRLQRYINENGDILKECLDKYYWYDDGFYEYAEEFTESVYVFTQAEKDVFAIDIICGDEVFGYSSDENEYLARYDVCVGELVSESGTGVASFEVAVYSEGEKYTFTFLGDTYTPQQESTPGAIYRKGGNVFCIKDSEDGGLTMQELPADYACDTEDAQNYAHRYMYSGEAVL